VGIRECQTCLHRSISHGPQGCTLCDCTLVRHEFVHPEGKTREQAIAEMIDLALDDIGSDARSKGAYHEAGHAVAAVAIGWPVERVVLAKDGSGGCILISDPEPCFDDLVLDYAGPVAERRYSRVDYYDQRSRHDLDLASDCAAALTDQEEKVRVFREEEARPVVNELALEAAEMAVYAAGDAAFAMMEEAEAEAERLVEEHWEEVQRVANELIAHEQVDGGRLTQICSGAKGQ
jgi:hypothetical protein